MDSDVDISQCVNVQVSISVEDLGRAWANMSVEKQTQFFIAAAFEAQKWTSRPERQWLALGDQLCNMPKARKIIEDIHFAFQPKEF